MNMMKKTKRRGRVSTSRTDDISLFCSLSFSFGYHWELSHKRLALFLLVILPFSAFACALVFILYSWMYGYVDGLP
jgi:hypothetical protein